MSNKAENKKQEEKEIKEIDIVNEDGVSIKSSDKQSKFETKNDQYKNFKTVSHAHKVKYYTIKSAKDYEDIILDLKEGKFTSIYAEKRRTWKKVKKISIYKDESDYIELINELFLTMANSVCGTFNSVEDIKKQYYMSKKLETLVKIVHLPEENFFSTEFVLSDVIYQDEFTYKSNDKGKWTLKVTKKMISPIPVEYTTQHGVMAKWYLKRSWNSYIKQIQQGMGA